VSLRSANSVRVTTDRLEAALRAKAITVFARIDHAAGAASVGMSLRPTELLIFGDPRAGTPLMQADQTIGIDLPLKALVWQNAMGDTFLSYNDPAWLAKRHELGGETEAALGNMAAALDGVAKAATAGCPDDDALQAADRPWEAEITSSGRAVSRRRLPVVKVAAAPRGRRRPRGGRRGAVRAIAPRRPDRTGTTRRRSGVQSRGTPARLRCRDLPET